MLVYIVYLQVLALGMVFIGATMTLIAHWPGSTSIGENPLKIAGPVLLAVGLVALTIGIVLVCVINRRERRRFQKQMADIITSRSYVFIISVAACCKLYITIQPKSKLNASFRSL